MDHTPLILFMIIPFIVTPYLWFSFQYAAISSIPVRRTPPPISSINLHTSGHSDTAALSLVFSAFFRPASFGAGVNFLPPLGHPSALHIISCDPDLSRPAFATLSFPHLGHVIFILIMLFSLPGLQKGLEITFLLQHQSLLSLRYIHL